MEPTTSLDPPNQGGGDAYLDTVSLLQEEIERLEAELRVLTDMAATSPPEANDPEVEAAAIRRIDELTTLLDERDETISLLWEHLAAIEETQSARSAEWEELHRWVEELEHRLGDSPLLDTAPETNGQTVETLREEMEAQRQKWERERRELEAELTRVRQPLETEGNSAGNQDLASFEQENHSLRDERRRLSTYKAECSRLTNRVTQLEAQIEITREQLQSSRNDLQNERLRHGTELAELRSGQRTQRLSVSDLTPSERVRALREHLHEVHLQEEEERKERQLSSRIARLLGRLGSHR